MSNMDKKEFLMTDYEKMRIEAVARMTAMGIDTVTIENYKRNGRIPVYSKNGENSLTSYPALMSVASNMSNMDLAVFAIVCWDSPIGRMNSFRENLRNELDFQGLTVKELSAKTGIVKGTLDNYLGIRASIPPADIAVKIAEALNVSVEFLVTGKERKENKNQLAVLITAEEKKLLNDLNTIPSNIQKTFKTLLHQTAESIEKNLINGK